MKRIGIIGLLHESNTYIEQPTTIEHFRANLLVRGDEVLDRFRNSPHELGGFVDTLEQEQGIQPVGVFAARATPWGTISGSCWEALMVSLIESLESYGPFDGLLVAPHGATVAETARDADGDWLARVRSHVGPSIPILGTLDLHANVSQKMIDATNALIAYQTNPHLDQRERGIEAAKMMVKTLRGQATPTQSLVRLAFCVNIERQATDEPQGRELRRIADKTLGSNDALLSISCLYGFPYAEVDEMGASVIAVSDGTDAAAEQAANIVAEYWWEHRQQFQGELLSVPAAIQLANAARNTNPSQPVGLLDMGDNVGGGAPGDATNLIHAWKREGHGKLLAVLADPQTVRQAREAGLHQEIECSVGGKYLPECYGEPYRDRFYVRSFSEGRFHESGTTHGGYVDFDQGPTVVLEGRSDITIIATTLRVAPLSLQQILSQGVAPEDFAAILIKGVHAPVAAYAQVCSQLLRVNTPGVTSADIHLLPRQQRNV